MFLFPNPKFPIPDYFSPLFKPPPGLDETTDRQEMPVHDVDVYGGRFGSRFGLSDARREKLKPARMTNGHRKRWW